MDRLKKLIFICIIMLAFLTGFLSNYAVNYVYIDKESPFLISFGNNSEEPGDWLNEEQIKVFEDKVIIYVKNALLSKYADTGSMLPTLGENSNGIKIVPDSPEQINIGDIVSYEQDNKLIVHRVMSKGEDEKGVYFVTKGDNNTETDGKIYFSQVKYVTIALIY